MVVATDAEQTSARPCSQHVFNLISYGSQAPRDSHMKWRHNSFRQKRKYAGGAAIQAISMAQSCRYLPLTRTVCLALVM